MKRQELLTILLVSLIALSAILFMLNDAGTFGKAISSRKCSRGQGMPCNQNQCGVGGIITCKGTCSGPLPGPTNLGAPCGCGGTVQCNGGCSKLTCPANTACQNGACITTTCASGTGQPCGCGGSVQCNGICSKPFCTANQTCENGTCTSTNQTPAMLCSFNQGQPCNRNVCGGTGITQCDGTCSASSPGPTNLGSPCNRNACGGTGTIQCNGACSAIAPTMPNNLGSSCNCGGQILCSGQCSSNMVCSSGYFCQNNQQCVPISNTTNSTNSTNNTWS